MNAKAFIAIPGGGGVERTERSAEGEWKTERLIREYEVACLAPDPHHPSVIYAGTNGSGLLRSDDEGRSWAPLGMQGQTVKAISVSPARPDRIYAGTRPAYMFVSDNRGNSWRELEAFRRIRGRWFWFSPADSPWTAYVQSIAVSPSDPDVLLAGMEFGAVVRSTDGGETWSNHLRGSLRDCHSMTFHHSDGRWVYEAGGSGGGAAVSRDGGASWTKRTQGLDRGYGWACAADPGRPEVWYASLAPGPGKAHVNGKARAYIYRADGGAPWERLNGGLPQPLPSMPYALLTDPAAPGHLYAGMGDGQVWHSEDYGESFRKLQIRLSGIHRSMVMLTDGG